MFDLRLVQGSDGNLQLQVRSQQQTVDASGAFCGLTPWSDWKAVPIVHGDQHLVSHIDVFSTRAAHPEKEHSDPTGSWDFRD